MLRIDKLQTIKTQCILMLKTFTVYEMHTFDMSINEPA